MWKEVLSKMLEWQISMNEEAASEGDNSWQYLASQVIRFNPSKRWRHTKVRDSGFFGDLSLPDGPNSKVTEVTDSSAGVVVGAAADLRVGDFVVEQMDEKQLDEKA